MTIVEFFVNLYTIWFESVGISADIGILNGIQLENYVYLLVWFIPRHNIYYTIDQFTFYILLEITLFWMKFFYFFHICFQAFYPSRQTSKLIF